MVNFLHVHTPLFSSKEFKDKSVHGKFGDNVLELDWAVGAIRDHLDKLNKKENTIIYFSTDQAAHVEEVSQTTHVCYPVILTILHICLGTTWWS